MANVFDTGSTPPTPATNTGGGNVFDAPDAPPSNNVFDGAPTKGLTLPDQLKPTTASMAADSLLEDKRRVFGQAGEEAINHDVQAGLGAFEQVTNFPWRKYMVEHAVQGKGMGQLLADQGYKPRQVWESPADIPPGQDAGDLSSHARTPLDIAIPGMEGATGRQLTNYALDSTIGRSVRFMQRFAGKPIADIANYGTADIADGINKTLGLKPDDLGDEHLSRTMFEVLGGEDMQLPPDQQETAQKQLQARYGETGSKMVEGAAHLVGTWPVLFFPGGGVFGDLGEAAAAGDASVVNYAKHAAANIGPKAVKAILPEAATAAVTAEVKHQAVTGAYQSMVLAGTKKGEDYADATGTGLELGGLLGMAGGMWNRYRLPKILSKSLNTVTEGSATRATPAWLETLQRNTKNLKDVAPPAAVIPANTMQQLGEQLDAAIASAETGRAAPKIRRGTAEPAAKLEGERSMLTAQDAGQAHEMTFSVEPGEVKKPSFSRFAINSKGQFVLQDVEIVAGPGGDVNNVRPAEGAGGKPQTTYHTTNVTVKIRETPIKRASDVEELALQPGRRLNLSSMSDDATGAMNALIDHDWTRRGLKDTDLVGGTPKYMAPEQAMVVGNILESSNRLGHEGVAGKPNFGPDAAENWRRLQQGLKEKSSVVMTVGQDGHVELTPLAKGDVRPHDDVVKPGDNALIDGTVPGVVTGKGENSITLATPASKHPVTVSPSKVTLSRDDLWHDYHSHPLAERQPLYTAHPEGGQGMERRVKTIIEAGKTVTVADVLRVAKRPAKDIGWAAGILRTMESDGKVAQVAPGVYQTTRPSIAKHNPIGQEGEFVYYGVGGPADKGQVGILRGPDSRTKGNYIVEVADRKAGLVQHNIGGNVWKKTNFLSVPGEDLASMKPTGVADPKRVSPDIDMYGWTKPMPDQWVQAAAGAFDDIKTMTKYWSKAAPPSAQGWASQKLQAFKEAFGGAMHTAHEDLRLSAAQKLYSAPHVMRSEALGYDSYLTPKLGAGSGANRALVKVLEAARQRTPNGVSLNQRELQQWITQYPKAAQAALSDITAMVKQLDEQSATLAKYGVGNIDQLENLRSNMHIDEYLTRNYAAWQMPRKEWASFARDNMTQEWHNVVKWMVDAKPGADASQYAAELDEILRLDNPLKGFQDKGYIKAESKGKLLAKQDVPEPIRAILGEHKDASTRLAFTLAYQRQLIKSVEGWNAVASHGSLWSPGWRPDMTLQVPKDSALHGQASGGFVHDGPAMRQLLEGRSAGLMGDSHALLRAAGWLGQRWKAAHTVYNQVAWVNNALRNVKGVMISGGFDGPADLQGFRDAATMLKDYANDPTIYGSNKLLSEAMDFDAVGPGLAGSELGLAQKKFQRRIFDTFSNTPSGTFMGVLGDMREWAHAIPEAVHGGYDAIDKVAKFGSYLNIRRKLIAAGRSIDDAAAIAALRVNQSFPNFTQTPDWLRRSIGAGNFSLAAPFATSKLEDVRVNSTLLSRLSATLNPMSKPHEREWDLVARVMAFAAMTGGAVTTANNVRRLNGISDADDKRQRAGLPLRGQNYHPMLLGSLDYDEHGRRVFYPMDQAEDLATMFRGNLQEQDPVLMNILMNNLDDVMGPNTVLGGVANNLAGSTGLYHPQPSATLTAPRADQTGLLSSLSKYGTPFLPQGPIAAAQAFQMGSPTGKLLNDEPWTPDQQLARALGGPKPMIAGDASNAQAQMENVRGLQGAERDIKSAAKDAALQGVDGSRAKFMIEQNVRELQKRLRDVPRPIKKSNEGSGGSK